MRTENAFGDSIKYTEQAMIYLHCIDYIYIAIGHVIEARGK